MISGCSADLLINILLTLLGYFPGHIHAFYLEYVYFVRREQGEITPPLPTQVAKTICQAVLGNSSLILLRGSTRITFKPVAQEVMGPCKEGKKEQRSDDWVP